MGAYREIECVGKGCRQVQDVMVLPEIVGSAGPVGAVVQLVALEAVVAAVDDQHFIQGIVIAEPRIVQVFVSLDTSVFAIRAVHQRQVVRAGRHAIPGLPRVLIVAHELVAEAPSAAQPARSDQITARPAVCAVQIAVRLGVMPGGFQYKMVPHQAGGECAARVQGVERAIGSGDLYTRIQ